MTDALTQQNDRLDARLRQAMRDSNGGGDDGHLEDVVRLLCQGAPVRSYYLDQAAVNGNIEIIKALLKHAPHAFEKHDLQSTLINAIVTGNSRIVEQLLEVVNPNFSATHENDTCLHLCVQTDHSTQSLLALLRAGANVAAVDQHGATALHLVDAHIAQARLLLEQGASPNFPDKHGNTPLHRVVRAGHFDMVQLFVEQGHADINQKNNKGDTPLSLALQLQFVNIVEFLMTQRSAILSEMSLWLDAVRLPFSIRGQLRPVNLIRWGLDPYQVNDRGETVVHQLVVGIQDKDENANEYRLNFLDGLLTCAPSLVHSATRDTFSSALHVAAAHNQVRAVKMLIRHGAHMGGGVDVNGCTPFLVAAKNGHHRVLQVFFEHTDPSELLPEKDTYYGQTALHWAAFGQHDLAVWQLLQAGASTRELNNNGQSPLHLASRKVMDASSKVNQDEIAKNPCAHNQRLAVLKALLQYGADTLLPDRNGDLPWFPCVREHRLDDCFLMVHAAAIQGLCETHRLQLPSTSVDKDKRKLVHGSTDPTDKRAKHAC